LYFKETQRDDRGPRDNRDDPWRRVQARDDRDPVGINRGGQERSGSSRKEKSDVGAPQVEDFNRGPRDFGRDRPPPAKVFDRGVNRTREGFSDRGGPRDDPRGLNWRREDHAQPREDRAPVRGDDQPPRDDWRRGIVDLCKIQQTFCYLNKLGYFTAILHYLQYISNITFKFYRYLMMYLDVL